MNLFYTPDIQSNIHLLSEEESRHCKQVLRLRQGDAIYLTDGRGAFFTARIADSGNKIVAVEVMEKTEEYGRRDYYLHLAVAPTKNIDRFEWMVEKATEIGVDAITPIICDHSERKQVRTDRLAKVAIAAMKQSLKAYLPAINEAVAFRDIFRNRRNGQLYIAHYIGPEQTLLKNACTRGSDIMILIGPEGDFSNEEIQQAIQHQFECISLGNSRLRTETAAIAACHTVHLLHC